jgi:hypothetical protein
VRENVSAFFEFRKDLTMKRLTPRPKSSHDDSAIQRATRELTRRDFVRIATTVGAAGAAIGGSDLFTTVTLAAPPKNKISTPVISCGGSTQVSINVQVCAGATGLPAGFSIQWMTKEDFDVWGWPQDSACLPTITGAPTCAESFCKGSFSGNANLSRYNLAAGECVLVNIGEFLFDNGASTNCPVALLCSTDYVFRAFGHATSALQRSDFTSTLLCSTLDCNLPDPGDDCTLTQGFWKTHGPEGCVTGNNSNEWPVNNLTLGTVNYTDLQLCSILNTPAAGNGLIALAHQLIAVKLNIANGADGTAVAAAIAASDALIGGLVIPPVGAGELIPALTSGLTTALANYNEGATGPGHCS